MISAEREYIVSRLAPRFGRSEAFAMAQWIAEEPDGSYDLAEVCDRLLRDEPLQYIFGHTDWRGLRLALSADTLIPRPETSELVDAAVDLYRELRLQGPVLDIGTGSGCIAIAVKKALPSAPVFACDISEGALRIASQNAKANGADVRFFRRDILSADRAIVNREIVNRENLNREIVNRENLNRAIADRGQVPGPFVHQELALVVSNPPYICESEKTAMEQNVLAFEPARALFVPDADPLLFYRTIARLHLAPALCFEINERFGRETADMLRQEGYTSVEIRKDICGKDRIVIALVQSPISPRGVNRQ